MGIKKLGPFLRKQKLCTNHVDLSAFAGCTFAIDLPIFMYRFLAVNADTYLDQFQQQVELFRRWNIVPIYIFDGKPADIKTPELKQRREQRHKMKATAENTELPFYQRVMAMEKVKAQPKHSHYQEVKSLFESLYVQYIISDADAEKHCAYLTRTGQADVVLSEDFDSLVYGATRLLTRLSAFQPQSVEKPAVEYCLNDILSHFQISHVEFVDVCILCGCDLSPKIRNVGPTKAFHLIRCHRNMETVVQYINKERHTIPDNFLPQCELARSEFLQNRGQEHPQKEHADPGASKTTGSQVPLDPS